MACLFDEFVLGHLNGGVPGGVGNFHIEGGGVLAADEAGGHVDVAACFHVQADKVGGADELVVDKHPQLVVLGGLFHDLGLGHDDFGMTGAVSDLNNEGGGVLAADEAGSHADAAACFHVQVDKVGGVDELVVDKHPQLVVLGGFFHDLGLGHHDFGMTGAVSDLDDKGGGVLTANEAGHQLNAATCFQVHVSDVSGADEWLFTKTQEP